MEIFANFSLIITLLFATGAQAMVIPTDSASTSTSDPTTTSTTTTTTTTAGPPLVVSTSEMVTAVHSRTCMQNFFTCPDQACVPVLQVCDGTPDCSDGADERICDNIPTMILGEQLVATMNKYPGCNAMAETCTNHITALGAPSSFSTSDVCRAYSRAAMCLIYESCDFSQEDRDFVKNVTKKIFQRTSDCEFIDVEDSDRCVSSCESKPDGDYQSCEGCGVYLTCYYGVAYDSRPCPGGLVWDDQSKRCEYASSTCLE